MMQPTDKQLKYAIDISEGLSIKLPSKVEKDGKFCSDFISNNKAQFHARIKKESEKINQNYTSISPLKNKIEPTSKHKFEQTIVKYWQNGLERTAFDGYGILESELQGVQNFSFDKIEYALEEFLCKNVSQKSNKEHKKFVRHLVMLLEPESQNNNKSSKVVIYVLPLTINFDTPNNNTIKKTPYTWVKATDEVPIFNHKIMGEEAEVDGLQLSNTKAFNSVLASIDSVLENNASIKQCLSFIDQCFNALVGKTNGCKSWIKDFNDSKKNIGRLRNTEVRFKLVDGNAVAGSTIHIRNCYKELLNVLNYSKTGSLQLLKNAINKDKKLTKSFTAAQEKLTWDNIGVYLGHMDSLSSNSKRVCYPLDPSQRISLSLFKKVRKGDLLAVNGPPGTGKTSLLRAVIADEWIRPLISSEKQPKCPIILACAATNQAVTNIISSFDAVPGPILRNINGERTSNEVCIESRWIPHLVSYGWYQPSQVDKNKSEHQGFQVISRKSPSKPWKFDFAAEDFGAVIKNISYLEHTYISTASEFFNESMEVSEVAERFREKIISLKKEMDSISHLLGSWRDEFDSLSKNNSEFFKIKEKYDHIISSNETGKVKQFITEYDIEIQDINNKLHESENLKKEIFEELNPSFIKRIFKTVFRIKNKSKLNENHAWIDTLNVLDIKIENTNIELFSIVNLIISSTSKLSDHKHNLIDRRTNFQSIFSDNSNMINTYDKIQKDINFSNINLKKIQNKIVSQLKHLTGNEQTDIAHRFKYIISCSSNHTPININEFYTGLLIDIQNSLDDTVRPKLFHLSARYWEARYILYRKEKEENKCHNRSSIDKIRELAMLAPVFVTTCHSAPKFMKCVDSDRQYDYLYDEADLLIIDEAGQGTPEIGACAFSFAKRAIVVGDTYQIKPVWNIDPIIDKLIQLQLNILRDKETLKDNGLLMSSGSIMLMAQNATQQYDENKTVPGVMLTNHYRCRDPIIQVCNQMVYSGALNVVASATEPKLEWRSPLGFLVVPGESTRLSTGSRCNNEEAKVIATWLKEQQNSILSHYNSGEDKKELSDLVAILTPYKGQVSKLRKEISNMISEKLAKQLVIGTVHSLQGSERPIVIFSMVETFTPEKEQFYDEDSSLINVAISRAKEVFIIALAQKAVTYGRNLNHKKLHKPSDHLFYHMIAKGKRLNSNELMLIESPHKSGHMQEALCKGMELEVIATNGHLTQLDSSPSWDPLTATEPNWATISDKEAQLYERVAMLWPDLEYLYIATDPDSEGEAIAWHFINRVKDFLPKTFNSQHMPIIKRMRFYNLSKTEIHNAYKNATNGLNVALVKGSLFRLFLDQIISRHYPKKLGLGIKNNFHAGIGRVQLSLLDIAYNYEDDEQYYIEVSIPNDELNCLGKFVLYNSVENKPIYYTNPLLANKAALKLQNMIGGISNITVNWEAKVHQLAEYPAINTAQFLKLACSEFNYSPIEIMGILQRLYEGQKQVKDEIQMESIA